MIDKENMSHNIVKELPLDCVMSKYFGFYSISLFGVALISNAAIIWLYIKHKKKLSQGVYILFFAIAIIDLFVTIVCLPVVTSTLMTCT